MAALQSVQGLGNASRFDQEGKGPSISGAVGRFCRTGGSPVLAVAARQASSTTSALCCATGPRLRGADIAFARRAAQDFRRATRTTPMEMHGEFRIPAPRE